MRGGSQAPKFTKHFENGTVEHTFNFFELPTKSNPNYKRYTPTRSVSTYTGSAETFTKLIKRFLTNTSLSESQKLNEIKVIFRLFQISDLAQFVIYRKISKINDIKSVKNYVRNKLRRKFQQNKTSVLNLNNGGGRFRYQSLWNNVSRSGIFNSNEIQNIALSRKMQKVLPHVYNQYTNNMNIN